MSKFADLSGNGKWMVELDFSKTKIEDIVFFEQSHVKTPAMQTREDQFWSEYCAKNPGVYDGPLICLKDRSFKGEKLHLGISKSGYKEHHAAFSVDGVRDDDVWSTQLRTRCTKQKIVRCGMRERGRNR